MTPAAPRYDPMILEAIRRLDDNRLPIAETCRRVGEVATRLGLPRPSYVHLRRLVNAERQRARELDGIFADVLGDVFGGRAPRLSEAFEKHREADARAALHRTVS